MSEDNNYPAKYEAPENRTAIGELMAEPVEGHIKWKESRSFDYPRGQKPIEQYVDPRNTAGDLLKQLKSPEGNREVVEEILNTWLIERLALDRYYQSEVLDMELEGGGKLYNIQDMYDRKRPNEQVILGLLTAKKRLLSLPGFSFTQVNMTRGPQQVNNGNDGNEKVAGKVS